MFRKSIVPWVVALLSVLAMPAVPAGDQPGFEAKKITEILPVDEAFRLGSYVDAEQLRVFWQVMPGYYLYRDKISISLDGVTQSLALPAGEERDDAVFGRVRVLQGLVEVSVPQPSPGVDVLVSYQGCAARGYCYPPQKRTLNEMKLPLNSGKVQL